MGKTLEEINKVLSHAKRDGKFREQLIAKLEEYIRNTKAKLDGQERALMLVKKLNK